MVWNENAMKKPQPLSKNYLNFLDHIYAKANGKKDAESTIAAAVNIKESHNKSIHVCI